MLVYRIAAKKYINDLTGTGSRTSGGRWNTKGTGIVYTSENISLATVEFLVHLPMSMAPQGLMLATIHIPDDITPKKLKLDRLPKDWKEYPAPPALAEIGSGWALSNESLLLMVPSAVIDREFNVLINPGHPDMNRLSIKDVSEFMVDDRLINPSR